MIVVIQCAGKKLLEAGRLRTLDGRPVKFVGDPASAPSAANLLYARPDDQSDRDGSWREVLIEYNQRKGESNPLGLLPAIQLYANGAYRQLAVAFGVNNVFVLSAGWGLIRGSFLTPDYDITFSKGAGVDPWTRRRRDDRYADFMMLPPETTEPVIFIGGKEYQLLFARLTSNVRAPRTVFYNSAEALEVPGCRTVRFLTTRRTNWQYSCAAALARGELGPFESRPTTWT